MGCYISIQELDRAEINSAIVLQIIGENSRYHGTTERSRLQTLGDAELILTEDGIYSQVLGYTSCCDRGFLYIPLRAITDVCDQAWFNGLYRIDRPHLVITYIVPGKGEFQAGWQMNNQTTYEQWRNSIEILREQSDASEFI